MRAAAIPTQWVADRGETEYRFEVATTVLRTLDSAGHRLTDSRRAVADIVETKKGHFTAAELVADARAKRPGIGRATVFRALDLFLELGVVERIDLPTGDHAYVVCEPERHHHHVVCSNCGRNTEIDDRGIRALSKKIAKRTGYRVDLHRLQLFGLCPSCQKAAS